MRKVYSEGQVVGTWTLLRLSPPGRWAAKHSCGQESRIHPKHPPAFCFACRPKPPTRGKKLPPKEEAGIPTKAKQNKREHASFSQAEVETSITQEKCIQAVLKEKAAIANPRARIETTDGCTVGLVTYTEAKEIIEKYEWLGTLPGGVKASYGLFSPEKEILGVVCFAATHNEARNICGKDLIPKTICLARGACVPWAPPNAASYFISRAIRMAHKDYGWEIFFAYSDESIREIGTIYQSLNWQYIGQGVGRGGKPRECFRTPEGKIYTSRKLRDMGINKAYAVETLGWEPWKQVAKHKYIWFEGSYYGKKKLKQLCRYPALPYPKRNNIKSEMPHVLIEKFGDILKQERPT